MGLSSNPAACAKSIPVLFEADGPLALYERRIITRAITHNDPFHLNGANVCSRVFMGFIKQ